MSKWELPPVTQKMIDAANRELQEDDEIQKILPVINSQKKISISYLQRTFGYSFPKAKRIYEKLVDEYLRKDGTLPKAKNRIKLIFLDVDGVLNSHSTEDVVDGYIGIDDKKVKLLKEIVDETDANIVLVSSWKQWWFKEDISKDIQDAFANHLDKKLKEAGLTIFDKTMDKNSTRRGHGIIRYIDGLSKDGIIVDKYVILDDETWDYSQEHIANHLVQTSFYKNGLEKKHVRKAIEKLC